MLQTIELFNRDFSHSTKLKSLLTQPQIDNAVNVAKSKQMRLDRYLLENNLITEEDVAAILAKLFSFNYMNMDTIIPDEHIIKMLTSEYILKHKFIPLTKNELGNMIVALGDPFDISAIQHIYALYSSSAEIIIAPPSKIVRLQTRIFAKTDTADSINQYNLSATSDDEAIDANIDRADLLNSPAVKLVDSCLDDAIAAGASDIHIEPYENTVRIRYRIDGVLHESTTFNPKMFPAVSTRIKIMAKLNIAERRIPQDGRISKNFNDAVYDFRVSTLPTVYGEKIVIRILDTTAFNYDRSKLGFLEEENKIIDDFLKKPHGIILLTGPTGCGKSTTLYSFIKEINREGVNVITVEDPVEYTIAGVNQVQVNPKANLTFAKALRSILRQDPNVVMIGEIRDEETAEIAMRMAITGHLVLSTLHTNDAPGAITRLMDLGLQPYFVSDALVGVISQRLVRRLCKECKEEYISTKEDMKILNIQKEVKIYRPCGCPACHNTGYSGRIGVHEVLRITEPLRTRITIAASTSDIREEAINQGMITLFESAKQKVLSGQTSINELLSIMYNKE